MEKPAPTQYPIHELLRSRWSPRAFKTQPVEADALLSLFEAARWAPSSSNVQPWAFIVTARGEPEFERFVELLNPSNAVWAQQAALLVLAAALRDRRPGQPNFYALYDLGQAVANLTTQATASGLALHQMGGFDRERSREVFGVPPEYDPVVALAVGYGGSLDDLPPDLHERELGARTRRPLAEFVFSGSWERPLLPDLAGDRQFQG